mgnify:CR=1 FL=1
MALNYSGSKADRTRSEQEQNVSQNLLHTAAILKNMERHKEIMRENIARQKRRASLQQQVAQKETVLKRKMVQKLKEEKRETYERFLKAQQIANRQRPFDAYKAPVFLVREPESFQHKTPELDSYPQRDDSWHKSEAEHWKRFEEVENEVYADRALPKNMCKKSRSKLLPPVNYHSGLTCDNPPSLSDQSYKEEISLPARLSSEPNRYKGLLQPALSSAAQPVVSKLKKNIYEHVDQGRKNIVSESDLNAREAELLRSLQCLNEKAEKLSKSRETPALMSTPNPKKPISHFENNETFTVQNVLDDLPSAQNLPEFAGEASSKTISAINDTPNFSLISDFPQLLKKDKNRYYKPPVTPASPELPPKNIIIQEKKEGEIKFEFNSALLKELMCD